MVGIEAQDHAGMPVRMDSGRQGGSDPLRPHHLCERYRGAPLARSARFSAMGRLQGPGLRAGRLEPVNGPAATFRRIVVAVNRRDEASRATDGRRAVQKLWPPRLTRPKRPENCS